MIRTSIERPDGASISYQLLGEGPAVTMIQGLGMPGDAWRKTAEKIADAGFRCIVVDNRGTGHSRHSAPMLTMPMLADDVGAVIAHETDEDEKSHVIGISLGGMISQHVALRHPEQVSGLMLLATTCGLPHNLINGAFFKPGALALLARICFVPRRPTLEEMQRLLAHPDSLPNLTEILLGWEEIFTHQPTSPRTYLQQLLAATMHSTGKHLERIPHRTYVLSGDQDFLIPPRNSELLAQLIPNARHEVIPRAGHIFPQEHPEVVPSMLVELHRELHPST